MLESELDLGLQHSGYRLSHFQIYNWGTFSDHVVTLDFQGENTLLTGANGSGKTTLVDALLTLLVPREYRTYNLSSGQDGKDGRTEESYVLGAYSTTKGESDYAANKEYLRDKNCHSILLGQFDNDNAEFPLTLMQIRYFTLNGTMQKLFVICEGSLSLQDMAERNVAFDATPGWKKRMTAAFTSTCKLYFFDTFKAYSIEFATRFGFRDREKALRIFSQTVGMKDLSNLNEFIRTRMLVEMDMIGEFNSTLANFETLMGTKKLIEKEEEQIRQLKAIETEAQDFLHLDTKLASLGIEKHTLPFWEGLRADQFLQKEIVRLENQKDLVADRLSENKRESEAIRETIEEVHRTLSSDKRVEREEELKRQREWLTSKLALARANRNNYKTVVDMLHLPLSENSADFTENRFQSDHLLEKITNKLMNIEDDQTDQVQQLGACNRERENVQSQLDAIGNRESNIPLEYLLCREQLCKDLQLKESDVPFLGELVQLRQDCLSFETGANAALHTLALTLLVQPYQEQIIATYLWNNALELHLDVMVIEGTKALPVDEDEKHQLKLVDDEEQVFFEDTNAPNRLDLMLEVKPSCTFAPFIKDLLGREVPYYSCDNLSHVLESPASFSERGLFHKETLLCKGATKKGEELHILGWDVSEKRERIRSRLVQLDDLKKETESVLEDLRKQKKHLEAQKAAILRLQEFKEFSEIDTASVETQIDVLDNQLFALRSEMDDLSSLKQQLRQSEVARDRLVSEQEELYRSQGANQQERKDAEREKKTYADQLANLDLAQYMDQIEKISARYKLPATFESLIQIKKTRNELLAKLDSQIEEISAKRDQSKKKTENLMDHFVRPNAKMTQTYPTWIGDVSDLRPDIEALDMFLAMLDKLEREDLPKYKERFANLRSRQMKSDIINFNTALRQWERHIKENIVELNDSLSSIIYQIHPETKIKLTAERVKDSQIRQFNSMLSAAIPDAGSRIQGNEKAEEIANQHFFEAVKTLLETLKTDDQFCKKVLDVRRWFVFAVEEYDSKTEKQVRYYQDSAGISGGQKAKLAYTILAAAIAHQFDVFDISNVSRSFRFVIVDEAFSKSDDENSRYAMDLFKKMDLQLMVVTPKDKVNLVEPYINSVQITVCNDGCHSFVHSLTKEKLREQLGR
ncbi:hypothetical protein SpiGrapes_0008 [Sphaerochaeta pleomorpha str. Grapes]|uniref:AAA+ ATPase domain-containing protein n=1 Tax=Sphaerochaeta pleomorpha (strain ATCC BAA-1885 / DSM 22778 / Grapes) TaxID=158190 RepID=G8QSH7_SPHPG|nr:SbcC/MukB-like Walker B domain-containing protein [Sphaerochaeta pleomorpha]AEV27876.1 hypothetical protein SpiGrapes_0008 [Sphaerochaeta pleomorpha str. Grapes]